MPDQEVPHASQHIGLAWSPTQPLKLQRVPGKGKSDSTGIRRKQPIIASVEMHVALETVLTGGPFPSSAACFRF